ncbi:MAG: tyrosine-type recombinase/integrase [Bacilli bacterium]
MSRKTFMRFNLRLLDYSFHSPKHTFAKRLAERGVWLEEIAKLRGHSNIQTTMIYITPSSATELRRAVQKL